MGGFGGTMDKYTIHIQGTAKLPIELSLDADMSVSIELPNLIEINDFLDREFALGLLTFKGDYKTSVKGRELNKSVPIKLTYDIYNEFGELVDVIYPVE